MDGWGVQRQEQKSVGWSINTAGIIKSPCSALCSPSLVTEHRKRLTTELCIAERVCMRVCAPTINNILKGSGRASFCSVCPVPGCLTLILKARGVFIHSSREYTKGTLTPYCFRLTLFCLLRPHMQTRECTLTPACRTIAQPGRRPASDFTYRNR